MGRLAAALLAALACATAAHAQPSQFGRNKVRWDVPGWNYFATEHFRVFFDAREGREASAREACVLAEHAYGELSGLFAFRARRPIPLFLYRDALEAEGSNISYFPVERGTDSYTEPLKNRAVAPVARARPADLSRVVRRAVAQAVLLDVLFGEDWRAFSLFKLLFLPKWVIEGGADWAEGHWDAWHDLVLRDAVVTQRLLPFERLVSFAHLRDHEVPLAFVQSEAAFRFVSETFGSDRVAAFFRRFQQQLSLSDVLVATLGMTDETFENRFFFWLRQRYWAQTVGKRSPKAFGQQMTFSTSERAAQARSPVFSEDGGRLYFVTDASGEAEVVGVSRDGLTRRTVAAKSFLDPMQRIVADGRPLSSGGPYLAFVAQYGGRYEACRLDPRSGARLRVPVPGDSLHSPALSRDGESLAVVSLAGRRSSVWIVSALSSGAQKPRELDLDLLVVRDPVFSPDGRELALVAGEEGRGRLVSVDLATGEHRFLTDGAADCASPAFTADGRSLAYVTEISGLRNVATCPRDGGAARVWTDVWGGYGQVSCSLAQPHLLAATAYERGGWNVYVLDLSLLEGGVPVPAAAPPAPSPRAEPAAALEIAPAAPMAYPKRRYGIELTPDLFYVIGAYDNHWGLVAGGFVALSDLLGDHRLQLYGQYASRARKGLQVDYEFAKFRPTVGLSLSDWSWYNASLDVFSGRVEPYWNRQVSGRAYVAYPFDVEDRVELGAARLSQTLTFVNPHLPGGGVTTVAAFTAFVRDTTVWENRSEPSRGYRLNLTVSQAVLALSSRAPAPRSPAFTTVSLDLQVYRPLWPGHTLALRTLDLVLVGPDARWVFDHGGAFHGGGDGTLRAFPSGEFYGDRLLVANAEWRWPFLRRIERDMWIFSFVYMKDLQGAFFTDVLWAGTPDGPPVCTPSPLRCPDVRLSAGTGLRLHTFIFQALPVTWRLDVSWRMDFPSRPNWWFGFFQMF